MEHIPFASFPGGLEVTYSDLKQKKDGSPYISIYFEEPNKDKTDFNSARFDFPGSEFSDVQGYDDAALDMLKEKHINRAGDLMLSYSKEDTVFA